MNAPAIERTSAAKAGWVVLLAFFAWLVFLLVPVPRHTINPEPPRVPPAPSKLAAVGLPDNPDLDTLPAIFAIWADQADWVNDRTEFAFWCPGTMDYSYFFEATRAGTQFRFRPIAKPVFFDPKDFEGAQPQTDEHPIKFLIAPRPTYYIGPVYRPSWRPSDLKSGNSTPHQVSLEMPTAEIKPAAPSLNVAEPVPTAPRK